MATISPVTGDVTNVWIPLPGELPSARYLGTEESASLWEEKLSIPCSRPGCTKVAYFELDGGWACSEACLCELLRSAIEQQAVEAQIRQNGNTRVQLGRILIEQGSITEAQLEQALRSQRATGAGRLGCWLRQQVDLPEADFAAALSIQWRCPVFRVGNFSASRMAGFLPRVLVEQNGALPLRVTGDPARLSVCFEDHVDEGLLVGLERMHGLTVEAGLLTASDFWQVTRELVGVSCVPSISAVAPSTDCMADAMSRVLVRAQASRARLVAINDLYWVRFWRPMPKQLIEPHQAFSAEIQHGESRDRHEVRDIVCGIAPAQTGNETDASWLANRMMESWR